MVVTRSILLTQTKAKVTQKTLEGLMVRKDQYGNTTSTSSKCADLDAYVLLI